MLKPLFLFLALLPLVVLPAAPARADNGPELWYQFENRVTFAEPMGWRPQAFRIVTVNFWGARFPGLGQALVRLSPIWEPHPNLSVAFNAVPGMEQHDGLLNQQFRLEAEPVFHGEWGVVGFNNRTRLEHRWAQQGNLWRVRNQVRLSLPGVGGPWIPYVADEVFYDLTAQSFNQNRALVGVSHAFSESIRLDLSYLLRSRLTGTGWDRDHALSISFSVNHRIPAAPAEVSP